MNGSDLIAKERRRQVGEEDYDESHDADHDPMVLARAGAAYAIDIIATCSRAKHDPWYPWAKTLWPWYGEHWKPTHGDPVRQLVKAGALIAAEIDRLKAHGIE